MAQAPGWGMGSDWDHCLTLALTPGRGMERAQGMGPERDEGLGRSRVRGRGMERRQGTVPDWG